MLANLARIYNKTRILEAGCGPGLPTKILSQEIPENGSAIFSCDLSDKMISYCKDVFENYSDFNANPNNKFKLHENTDDIKNIETYLSNNPTTGKSINFFVQNFQELCFEDNQFEAYLNNLCFQLCSDHVQGLKEAYRVLKPNGMIAFSIWGDPKETELFRLHADIFKDLGIDSTPKVIDEKFKLGSDLDSLENTMKSIGFKNIKMERTNILYDVYTVDDYFNVFGINHSPFITKLDEPKKSELLSKVREILKSRVEESQELTKLNIIVVVANK